MDGDRREYDARLRALDEKLDERFKVQGQKLDDHGQDLREIRGALTIIAQQSERLNSLFVMQNELRDDVTKLETRMRSEEVFQAACPAKTLRSNINALWLCVMGDAGAFGATLLAHIFGGKP